MRTSSAGFMRVCATLSGGSLRAHRRQGVYRAGCYETLETVTGDVTLRMPKFKGIRFATEIVDRYCKCGMDVGEALTEMHYVGVSTR